MRILPFLALFVAVDAAAITEPDSGGWIGAATGLAIDTKADLGVGLGWQATAGLWFGKHDGVYAFGKYTGIGVTVRQAYLSGNLVTEPMLELRRGADIVVVTTQLFVSGGPQIAYGEVGAVLLAGGGIKYRMSPQFGIVVRAELGVSVLAGSWAFRNNIVAGVEFAAPWSGRRE
ncbi:MAG: hypothetical protein ACJAZO_000083 [Myxococcota bacterium]|jgi:hypothetical protein